ncbi:MAG: hypothetical protein EZS28_022832 [Streblomastix strix]|uniref:Uncharacterized protein n=1 Tax=Streblomastix strix TaxID=222440 RepID=A0A5J4VGE3_9EUKA|nr:MAG: hypothetical protein EZS28_022832 [Streblomastix strix]
MTSRTTRENYTFNTVEDQNYSYIGPLYSDDNGHILKGLKTILKILHNDPSRLSTETQILILKRVKDFEFSDISDIASLDKDLSKAATNILTEHVDKDDQVSEYLLRTGYFQEVLHILSDQSSLDHVKANHLDVVMKIAEKQQGFDQLRIILQPALEIEKQRGQKNVMQKATMILNQLQSETKYVASSSECNLNIKQGLDIEETYNKISFDDEYFNSENMGLVENKDQLIPQAENLIKEECEQNKDSEIFGEYGEGELIQQFAQVDENEQQHQINYNII